MGVNGGAGIALTGSPLAASVPSRSPGVTTGGLTIRAADRRTNHRGGGRVDAVQYSWLRRKRLAFRQTDDRHA